MEKLKISKDEIILCFKYIAIITIMLITFGILCHVGSQLYIPTVSYIANLSVKIDPLMSAGIFAYFLLVLFDFILIGLTILKTVWALLTKENKIKRLFENTSPILAFALLMNYIRHINSYWVFIFVLFFASIMLMMLSLGGFDNGNSKKDPEIRKESDSQ